MIEKYVDLPSFCASLLSMSDFQAAFLARERKFCGEVCASSVSARVRLTDFGVAGVVTSRLGFRGRGGEIKGGRRDSKAGVEEGRAISGFIGEATLAGGAKTSSSSVRSMKVALWRLAGGKGLPFVRVVALKVCRRAGGVGAALNAGTAGAAGGAGGGLWFTCGQARLG